jgi:hypothetical protein
MTFPVTTISITSLDEYIAAAGIAGDANGYLFRTTMRRSGILTEKPMHQQDAYRMIQRRAKAAGIETKIGNHTFRATGITAYLKNSGKLEVAQHIANHESPGQPSCTTAATTTGRMGASLMTVVVAQGELGHLAHVRHPSAFSLDYISDCQWAAPVVLLLPHPLPQPPR